MTEPSPREIADQVTDLSNSDIQSVGWWKGRALTLAVAVLVGDPRPEDAAAFTPPPPAPVFERFASIAFSGWVFRLPNGNAMYVNDNEGADYDHVVDNLATVGMHRVTAGGAS